MLLWFLCLLWVLSVADKCGFNHSTLNVSSAMDSLKCLNNYLSYFECTWREEPGHDSSRRLQLLFYRRGKTFECKDQPSAVEGTRACRCQINVFSTATTYKVFFDPLKLCSSIRPVRHDLSLLLRTSPPVALTTSNPYPQSSALNKDMAYQVDSRSPGLEDRTVEEHQKTLAEVKWTTGHNEARTRKTYNYRPPGRTDPVQVPRVDCVQREAQGQQEIRCSWEQSMELSHFITYQLLCHSNHTATPQKCCQDLKVRTGHLKHTVKFSCHIEHTSSSVFLELVPTHTAKKLKAAENSKTYQNIHHHQCWRISYITIFCDQ